MAGNAASCDAWDARNAQAADAGCRCASGCAALCTACVYLSAATAARSSRSRGSRRDAKVDDGADRRDGLSADRAADHPDLCAYAAQVGCSRLGAKINGAESGLKFSEMDS
jgi:hypothetical protein